jgi:nanoRNase/pAp phosphatase (c-di-AMP/oligoRNAs hydrolase)
MKELFEQTEKLVSQAKKILVCLTEQPTVDDVAAALVWSKIAAQLDKEVLIVSTGFELDKFIKILPDAKQIEAHLPRLKTLHIKLPVKGAPLDKFSYDVATDAVLIYLEPLQGEYDTSQIKIETSDYYFDLIVSLGVSNYQTLGELFSQAPDFFYNTALINIDYNLNNENYGQVNLVVPVASSVCEVMTDLLEEIWPDLLAEKSLTEFLLSGIVSTTRGLQSPAVRPVLLEKMSRLMSDNISVAEIVAKVFYNKSIAVMRLWGRALARLKEDKELKLVWSLLPYDDFLKTGVSDKDLLAVIDEFISNYQSAEIVALLWQKEDMKVTGVVKTTKHNALELIETLKPTGSQTTAVFNLSIISLLDAERILIETLRQKLARNIR